MKIENGEYKIYGYDLAEAHYLDNRKMIIDNKIFIFNSSTSLADFILTIDYDINDEIKEKRIEAVRDVTEEELANSTDIWDELNKAKSYVLSIPCQDYEYFENTLRDVFDHLGDTPFLVSLVGSWFFSLDYAMRKYGCFDLELLLLGMLYDCASEEFEAMTYLIDEKYMVVFFYEFAQELMDLVIPAFMK